MSISAALVSGAVWTYLGPQWVFFFAAFLSLGNLYAAWRIRPAERAPAQGGDAEVAALLAAEDAVAAP